MSSRVTRRDFVRVSAATTVVAGLASLLPARPADAKAAADTLGLDMRELVRVEIENVIGSDRRRAGVVLLKGPNDRYLPVNVGEEQARSIRDGITRQLPPRPMTHDMIQNFLDTIAAEPAFVVIWQLHEMTFYAYYVFKLRTKTHAVDCRPSDAIALAVRSQTPIYVARTVMNQAGVDVEDVEGYDPGNWA